MPQAEQNTRYIVPAPLLGSSESAKMRFWKIEMTPRQIGEAGTIAILTVTVHSLLGWLGSGIGGIIHTSIILTLIVGGIVYVFVPIHGRMGTAWLALAVRWRRERGLHQARMRRGGGPQVKAIRVVRATTSTPAPQTVVATIKSESRLASSSIINPEPTRE